MPLAEGQEIAGYTILRSIGAGGMGEVYLAQHPRLPRLDALKVLSATVCADDEYRQRFNREAEIAATLWHPHIVEVHDRGDVGGQLWISMDYVEGTDAGRLLAEEYPKGMPPDDVVKIIEAVAGALDYAHQRNLTHRDVKPANILIANAGTANERILLADFGIARRGDDASGLTGTNMTVGTVAYAAPEQLKGEDIDGRADQYALAATAFELLTGKPPFQHSNPAVVISQQLTADPPKIGKRRPELSGLSPVFDKALAKSPADRYERCIDFARALVHRIGNAGTDGDADGTEAAIPAGGPRHARSAEVTPRRRRGRRTAAVAVGIVGIAAIAGAAYFVYARHQNHAAPTAAPPTHIAVPVVLIGTDCATLGAAGITESGQQAYCAHLGTTDDTIWSLYGGEIDSPTMTPTPGDTVYPSQTESPLRVCMQQTGQSRQKCHDEVVSHDMDPPATDPPTTVP
jgi:serine/threonine protein kinase, bacterial